MPVIDFTAAHYLGLRHGSRELPTWRALSTGRPAILGESVAAATVARMVARLQGREAGVVAPSTLHLFWDLFGRWPGANACLLVDRGVYRVAQWGVERAAGKGAPIEYFQHLRPESLAGALRRSTGKMPVVVTDGWCPWCGAAAPLADYAELLEPHGGWLVIDDTQAFGILGAHPSPANPWGVGGGGALPHAGLGYPRTAVITSLAKAFGVPLATMTGPQAFIRRFRRVSETRTYASPPSEANLTAALSALRFNFREGHAARAQLFSNVSHFQRRLWENGIAPRGAAFPVQAVEGGSNRQTADLRRYLEKRGLQTIVVASHDGRSVALCCILRRDHSPAEIERLATEIVNFTKGLARPWPIGATS